MSIRSIVKALTETSIPGTYPEPGICTRFDYHDGPCNGYPNTRCALKHKLEREGKLPMIEEEKTIASQRKQVKERFEIWDSLNLVRRSWIGTVWAWVKGTV